MYWEPREFAWDTATKAAKASPTCMRICHRAFGGPSKEDLSRRVETHSSLDSKNWANSSVEDNLNCMRIVRSCCMCSRFAAKLSPLVGLNWTKYIRAQCIESVANYVLLKKKKAKLKLRVNYNFPLQIKTWLLNTPINLNSLQLTLQTMLFVVIHSLNSLELLC